MSATISLCKSVCNSEVFKKLTNWMMVFHRWTGTRGVDHVYPGVSPQADLQPGEERVYHKYYMWVALVLACQTAMFMIPRYIWKSAEGGKIRMLIQGLMEPIIDDDTKSDQIGLIVKYFRLNRGGHVSTHSTL